MNKQPLNDTTTTPTPDLDIIWHGKTSSTVIGSVDGETSITHFQDLFKLFLEKLNISSTRESILRAEIEGCANEHELISLLQPNFEWVPLSDTKRFQKCGEMSSKLRERANASYKCGDLKQAMRGYNLAIMFAPVQSSEMGLAYANRSALLVQLNKFEAATNDINSALQNNFPESLKDKLEQRLVKCKTSSNFNNKQMEQQDAKTSSQKNAKEYFYETFFTLKNPNQVIPNAEGWVKIDYREDRGRRLVTTENVPAGTLILIDKPFVSILNNLLTWEWQNCHWCYKPLLAGVPCELCTFTIYCDENCRRKSCLGSHKYEHNYLAYLHTLTANPPTGLGNLLPPPSLIVTHKELQALRLLAIVGSDGIYKLFLEYQKTRQIYPTNDSYSQIAGFNSKMYDCASYRPMYHLISHGLRTGDCREKLEDVFKALFLTQMLRECCPDFFNSAVSTNCDDVEFDNFVASLILRHLGNIKYNAISVSKLERRPFGSGEETSVPFATAVNPLISLANHSCTPNAAPIKKFHMLESALVTLKNLEPGEEICITYKPLFPTMKTNERRGALLENYNFYCTCTACLNNWSAKSIKATEQLESAIELRSHCSECQKLEKFGERILAKPCETCLRHHLQQIAKIDAFENELYKADEELEKGNFKNAIEILKPCLDYFSNNFSPCYSLSLVALDLFKRALVRLANEAENFQPLF